MNKRVLALLPVACVVSSAPALASDPIGTRLPLSPQQIAEDHRPFPMLGRGTTALFSGSYEYSIAVPLPPSRGGLVPSLRLQYSSQQVNEGLGSGWDLGLDYVRRAGTEGVPRFVGPSATNNDGDDEFDFKIGDHVGRLKYVTTVVDGRLLKRDLAM
jgi:hypothetical protein